MPVNLSIKNVPEDVVARLKQRAKRHHRSLQGELSALVEEAAELRRPKLTVREVSERIRKLGLPRYDEATQDIRENRDRR